MPDPQTPPAGVTEIEAPDGTVIEFPSSMGDVEITAAMQKLYPPVTQTPPGKPLAPPVSTASPSTSVVGNGVAASNGVGQAKYEFANDSLPASAAISPSEGNRRPAPLTQAQRDTAAPFIGEMSVESNRAAKEHVDRTVARAELLSSAKDLESLPFLRLSQVGNTSDPNASDYIPSHDAMAQYTTDQKSVNPNAPKDFSIRQYVMDDLMESLPEHRKTYIESKIAQDKWTDADAAALEMEAVARAAKVVDARISMLEDRVKAGEKVPDAEIEDIMAHAKYVDKEASGQFAEIVRRHPEVARERLDDIAKSKASTARLATTPQAYIVEPAIRAAAQFGANILRTPRTFSFNDEYGWTDQLAEHAEKVMGRSYAQQPESLKGDLVTKDADGNYSVSGEKLLPKTVETLVSSLMMVGAGGGTPAGLIGSSFVQTNADYYKDAIDEGASSSDAGKYAASAASVTSALELISPQNYLFNKAVRDMGKQAVKEMVKGETLSEAMKKSLFVLKEVGGENLQEMSQLAADKVMAGIANTALSADNPYFSGALDDQFKPEELAETIILTTAMSGIMSGVAATGKNPLNAEAVKWAVDNSEEFVKSMEKYGVPKDQQQAAVEKLAAYKKAFGGFKETGDASKDVTIAEAVIKKDEIKQKQTENPVDDLIAMVQGNKWEKQLEEQDKIIADELGIDLVEVAKKQEADKLREQYDKAKLKSEITGTPMPEGMTKPKEVVLEPKDVEVVAPKSPNTPATSSKPTFGEIPDKEADAPVWSSLSIGSVLTDSSDPNSHWVVVDDATGKKSGNRVMSLAIVEKEADGTWTAGPPSIIVSIGPDGSLRTDTSPRYSYTDANGNRNMAIMQPSDVSIPFGELIQEDAETGERFIPQWAKDMTKPKEVKLEPKAEANTREVGLNTTPSDGVDTDALGFAVNDIAASVEDGKKYGVVSHDGSVTDEDQTLDVIDADYGRIRALSEKGKLTKEALVKTSWGRALYTSDLDRVADALNNNPDLVDKVFSDIESRLKNTTTTNETTTTQIPKSVEPTPTTKTGEVGTMPVVDEQTVTESIDPELDDILDIKRQNVPKQEGVEQTTAAPRMTTEKATNLLKKVAPGVKIVTHKDQPSLSKAYARNSGRNVMREETATTKGFYDSIRKEIHLGPFASDTTMAHEVMHPLFRAAFAENQAAVKNLYNELLKDPDLAPYVEHGNKPSYKAKGEAMVHEEAIVQFMAGVYEGKLDEKFKNDKTFLQKVRDFIKDVLAKLGIRKNEIDFSKVENLKQLAGLIHEAMRSGGVATAGGVDTKSEMVDDAFGGKEVPKTPIGDIKTVEVDGKERTVFNSNGKPIHPTVEGVRNFWRWFGNSKVVDEQGRPLVVYHGSHAVISEFRERKEGGRSYWFTEEERTASTYGPNTTPSYLKIEDPGVLDAEGSYWDQLYRPATFPPGTSRLERFSTDDFSEESEEAGRDGIIIKQIVDDNEEASDGDPNTHFAVFSPTQIKSATGNYGSFDPNEASIVMARGTPQEIADTFKKKGYTDKTAREYMDNAGVDEQTIKDVMDAMKPAKPEPPERKKIPEGRKERESAERLRHDDPELYKLLSADDISYEKIPEKNKISLKTAEDMVRVLGPEKALLAVKDRNNGMPEAVRTYMARMIPKVFEEKGDMTAAKNAVNEMLELAASEASGLQAFRGFANSKEAYIPSIVMVNTRKMIEDIIEKKMGDTKAGRYQRKKYEKTKKALEDLNKEAVDTVLRGAEVNRVKNKAAAPQQTTSSKERIKKAWDWDNNKVVKKERKAEILKALRGTFGTGPNPLYVELAAGYMEAGARTFAAVAEEVSRELGRKAVPYFKEAYKKAFGYLKERGVDAGEPDTDAQINEVIANVNAKELVDQLKKALAKNDQKTSAEILAKLQEQSKSMDAWGAYRDYAVEKLERMANQEIADARLRNDAMREFTDGLVRNMSAQMREEEKSKGVPPKEKPAEKSDIQIIGEAFKNFEKYKEVWSKTQNEFKARLRAAEARLEKADTPIAKEEAQQAIEKETARLEKLDAYFGDLMLKPFSEVGLGRAVKAGLKDLGQKIDTIVRQHYTVGEGVRRSLQEKLVTEAGLTNEAAKVLSDAVGKEFDKLTKARREKIIEQYLGRHAVDRVKKERSKSTDADKVTLLENIGALSDEDFLHAYAEANGWPAFTEETAKELKRLADLIQTSPKGRPRNEAIADLLTYQANLPGVTKWDLLGGIWYANMLSGYNTQTVNVFANIFRVVAEYDVAAIRATASGHPGDAKHLAKAMAYGLLRGLPEFTSTLRTGYSPIRGRVEEKGVMERKRFSGAAYPLNALKYVSRFMKAADVLAYEPLRELRAYQLAIKDAREEGGPTERQRQRALEILNRDNTSLKEAAKQAREEYEAEILSITSGFSKKYQDLGKEATKEQKEELRKKESQAIKKANLDRRRRVYELVQEGRSTDMLERSARFAQASTYNSPPPGAFGVVARAINGMIRELPVLKYMIPFVNVITNVLHDGMNYYMGAGIIRAARGGSVFKAGKDNEKLSQAERDDLRADYFVKGVIGVVTMVALMLLSGDDDDDLEITADGHGNWADNAVLRRSGWMPYSIRLPGTKTYISYQYTPLVLSLGFVGHFRDAQKYRKEKIDDKFYTQAAVAFSRNMSTGADMSFLSNTSDLLSNIVDDRNENKVGDATSGVMKIIKRTMIPALYDEAAKNMEAAFKMPEKEVRGTLMGQFLKDIPYARGMYEDKYDAFGPVIPNGNPFRRFVSIKDEQDPLIHLMVDKDFSMKAPHPGTLTVINDDGDERVMTDQERRFFYDQRAMIIREEVDGMYDELQSMDKKEFAEEMSKIQSYATYSAKALIEY